MLIMGYERVRNIGFNILNHYPQVLIRALFTFWIKGTVEAAESEIADYEGVGQSLERKQGCHLSVSLNVSRKHFLHAPVAMIPYIVANDLIDLDEWRPPLDSLTLKCSYTCFFAVCFLITSPDNLGIRVINRPLG